MSALSRFPRVSSSFSPQSLIFDIHTYCFLQFSDPLSRLLLLWYFFSYFHFQTYIDLDFKFIYCFVFANPFSGLEIGHKIVHKFATNIVLQQNSILEKFMHFPLLGVFVTLGGINDKYENSLSCVF